MVTPLVTLIEGMSSGDFWEDAGIIDCLKYAAARANIPHEFRHVLDEFL